MPSGYPAALDKLSADLLSQDNAVTGEEDPTYKGAPGEGAHAKRHNDAANAINAVQSTLGTNPQGGSKTVAERLEALGLAVAGKATPAEIAAEAKAREEADAALTTGVNARATIAALEAEIKAREAAEVALRESIAREDAPEKFWPALAGFKLFKTQALVPAANSGHLLRWKAPKTMTLRGVSFCTTVAATNNDECAVVIKAEDGKTTLAKSAGTAGVLNAAVTLRKDVDFTADLKVTGGNIYYLGFQYGTVGGTAATLLSAEVVNGNSVGGIWGTAPGLAYIGQATPTFPWATETAFSTASNRVYLIARER